MVANSKEPSWLEQGPHLAMHQPPGQLINYTPLGPTSSYFVLIGPSYWSCHLHLPKALQEILLCGLGGDPLAEGKGWGIPNWGYHKDPGSTKQNLDTGGGGEKRKGEVGRVRLKAVPLGLSVTGVFHCDG